MAEQSPDPWRIVWRFVTSDGVLVALLLAMAVSVTLTAWIPQQPSSDVGYARWLSQMQARFGGATSTMLALGLFSIIPSLGFRTLLALLTGCLLLRLIEGADQLRSGHRIDEPDAGWKQISNCQFPKLLNSLRRRRYRVVNASSFFQIDRWPWSGVIPLITHLGALLLLTSLLLSHLLGWQAEDLILQKGARRSLPGINNWVALTGNGSGTRHSPGVVAFIEDSGPGVQVSALGGDGEPLQLLVAPDGEPSTELRIPLIEDTYFAIPEAELIVRLKARSEEAYTRTDVQIYSSPTGEIISERVTDKGGEAAFNVGGVTLTFVSAPYASVTATHNPGRLPAGLGLMMVMVGTVGSLTWPQRRFWLRAEEGSIEASGPFPSWLQHQEEDR